MVVLIFLLFFMSSLSLAKDLLLASTYPIYYPLSYIAGDRFNVDVLIKTLGDVHHYELKPADLKKLQGAKAFFYLGVEKWERKIADRLPKGKSYSLDKNINFIYVGKQKDPHLWLSPKAYAKMVENIKEALTKLDPSASEYYQKRYEEFIQNLKQLDNEYSKFLANCQKRTIIITHLSALYLGRDYNLEVVGLRGLHAEEEPKPSEMREMVEKAKKAGVKYVFYELGHDEKLARRIAKEIGANVISINTSLFPEDKQDDYFSIMRKNLRRLGEGLNCQAR